MRRAWSVFLGGGASTLPERNVTSTPNHPMTSTITRPTDHNQSQPITTPSQSINAITITSKQHNQVRAVYGTKPGEELDADEARRREQEALLHAELDVYEAFATQHCHVRRRWDHENGGVVGQGVGGVGWGGWG